MRLAIMILAVMVLAATTEVMAQDSSQGKVVPYYHFYLKTYQGKNVEVTLKNGKRLSGMCRVLTDQLQVVQKSVSYDIPYSSVSNITIRRSWFGKLKDIALAPYYYIATPIGMIQYFNDAP